MVGRKLFPQNSSRGARDLSGVFDLVGELKGRARVLEYSCCRWGSTRLFY